MYGIEWTWEEETNEVSSDLTEYKITIINKSKERTVFIREGYLERK